MHFSLIESFQQTFGAYLIDSFWVLICIFDFATLISLSILSLDDMFLL